MEFILGLGAFFLFMIMIVSIIVLVAQFKLFEKAGEGGWKMFIPIYNVYTVVKVAFSGKKNWLFFLTLLPLVSALFGETMAMLITLVSLTLNIYIYYNFIRRFADTGLSTASIFFPMIIFPIIAFGKYEYEEYMQ